MKDFESALVEAVPEEVRKDIVRFEAGRSFLASYGTDKAISDVFVQHTETGSWLAILGTPLISLPTANEKGKFLERFLSDPKPMLKDEIGGCFAALAYDGVSDTMLAATDFNNTTPIFYSATATGLYISSHELPLARFLRSEIDPLGFSQSIQLKLTWQSHTRFRNIQKLLPCEMKTFHGKDGGRGEQYWQPPDEPQWPSKFDDVVDRWLELLKDSVQAYYDCSRNRTVICDFTAGEDSRLLLSQCHDLKIPFRAMVDGSESDIDVLVAKEASRKVGFDLVVRQRHLITEGQLLNNATYISLMNDAYQDYFQSCTNYATDSAHPPENYRYVKYCGAPGGEAYRGAYYLRGKAFFPSSMGKFDYQFFTKMKWLLDFHPGLMRFSDEECRNAMFASVQNSLKEVEDFPIGTKIDHLLRLFQTCNAGLIYKNPRYLPFAGNRMTRSIYSIPPHFKRGGKLTKACTEILYPELALVKTQKGVPTIRRTMSRTLLFMPEHLSMVKGIARGAVSRLFKWTDSNKPSYKWSENGLAIKVLLNRSPYADWFASSRSMVTGSLYNSSAVDSLLSDARVGSTRYVPILGRIINQELACRWVYRET